ncbi:helix-turn-helix domain-containing protein [Amycolatopsis sp. NPDC058278]|uniref:helix-turn-helix domain-containing protein n=1 Tax=Amycolatopsis sp. NPDC058278 TaxID=3346417 RepID=UPI0036DDA8BC
MRVQIRHGLTAAGVWEVVSWPPHPRLRGQVLGYRGCRLGMEVPRRRLELPVDVVTMFLGFGEPLRFRGAGTHVMSPATAVSPVAGPHEGAVISEHSGRLSGIEVSMTSLAAFTLFGLPVDQLANRIVDLTEPCGFSAPVVAGALAALPDWPERFALLDELLLDRLDAGPAWSPQVEHLWQRLRRSRGRLAISALAAEVGWSGRHLESRFRQQLGLPPKRLARILRLQNVLHLLTAGNRPLAQVAVDSGYYDQAHLGTDFKALTSCTPAEFRRIRAGAPVMQALLTDRLAGHVTSAPLAVH